MSITDRFFRFSLAIVFASETGSGKEISIFVYADLHMLSHVCNCALCTNLMERMLFCFSIREIIKFFTDTDIFFMFKNFYFLL